MTENLVHTEKQIKARERNWTKARLLANLASLSNNTHTYTKFEEEELKVAYLAVKTVLEHWDKSTEEHLGVKLKPYKCEFCSKRSNVSHFVKDYAGETINLCKKHSNMYKLDE